MLLISFSRLACASCRSERVDVGRLLALYRIIPLDVWKNSCASFCLPCVDSRVVFVLVFVFLSFIRVHHVLDRFHLDFFEGIMGECLVPLCG